MARRTAGFVQHFSRPSPLKGPSDIFFPLGDPASFRNREVRIRAKRGKKIIQCRLILFFEGLIDNATVYFNLMGCKARNVSGKIWQWSVVMCRLTTRISASRKWRKTRTLLPRQAYFSRFDPRDDTNTKEKCYTLYHHWGFNADSHLSNGNMKIGSHGELERLQ